MSTEANTAIVRRFEDASAANDIAAIDALCAPPGSTATSHRPRRSRSVSWSCGTRSSRAARASSTKRLSGARWRRRYPIDWTAA